MDIEGGARDKNYIEDRRGDEEDGQEFSRGGHRREYIMRVGWLIVLISDLQMEVMQEAMEDGRNQNADRHQQHHARE